MKGSTMEVTEMIKRLDKVPNFSDFDLYHNLISQLALLGDERAAGPLRRLLNYSATYQPLRKSAAIGLGKLLKSDKLIEAGKQMEEDFGERGDYIMDVTLTDGKLWQHLHEALDKHPFFSKTLNEILENATQYSPDLIVSWFGGEARIQAGKYLFQLRENPDQYQAEVEQFIRILGEVGSIKALDTLLLYLAKPQYAPLVIEAMVKIGDAKALENVLSQNQHVQAELRAAIMQITAN
jgi:HEAT repeat protein